MKAESNGKFHTRFIGQGIRRGSKESEIQEDIESDSQRKRNEENHFSLGLIDV